MTWPDGWGTQLRLDGRARDLFTPRTGEPVVLALDAMHVGVGVNRTIAEITVEPDRPAVAGLVGAKGGGALRAVLDAKLPEERRAGTPLALLLDDIAGATLVAPFAWSRWSEDWQRRAAGLPPADPDARARISLPQMEGICAGFVPGSSALLDDGTGRMNPETNHNVAPAPPLAAPDDPWSWHELDEHPPVAMRRARRIDVWRDHDVIAIDAMFRDSCWQPDGGEVAVHEYRIDATADAVTGEVTAVRADPRVLPFAECPGAAPNASLIVGANLADLRAEVLDRIRLTDCCTHLNDALRSLAEVPVIAAALER